MSSQTSLRETFTEFPYQLFNVVLSNRSFLDIKRLDIFNTEEAHDYLKNYGFDLDDQAHRDQVYSILTEAKQFIQTYLLEDPDTNIPLIIPPYIQCEDDVRNLLVEASKKDRDLNQRWACAVLRVAHTITHVENDLAKYFFPAIKKQIFSRFMQHVSLDKNNQYTLGSGNKLVNIKYFEMKSEKTKESMIMKLLHKKESVTADIFDRIGVRIITYDKLDVLIVLKYLAENHVISFANVKPSRTRNTLVDINHFVKGIQKLKNGDISSLSEKELKIFLDPFTQFETNSEDSKNNFRENNPYSSTEYTSVQLTVRHLVTVQDPFNKSLNYKFFFPFEIQILDDKSYEESRHGRASHSEYKKAQMKSVRNRVLGNIIRYYLRQESNQREDNNE